MCPLCESEEVYEKFKNGGRSYWECPRCDLLYRQPPPVLSLDEERQRYLQHDNSESNAGYVAHLQRFIGVFENYLRSNGAGLDYGCGHTPVLSKLLIAKGFKMECFDPFFDFAISPNAPLFDFILCSEAIEHFVRPRQSLVHMKSLLSPGGIVAIMTGLREGNCRSPDWWYLRDATHRCFYSLTSFKFIAKFLGLNIVHTAENVVVMANA